MQAAENISMHMQSHSSLRLHAGKVSLHRSEYTLYPRRKNSASSQFIQHLLLHDDNRFAHNGKFLFALVDQSRRHVVAREVYAKAKSGNRETLNELMDMLNSGELKAKLDEAKKDPNSVEAKKLNTKLIKYVIGWQSHQNRQHCIHNSIEHISLSHWILSF